MGPSLAVNAMPFLTGQRSPVLPTVGSILIAFSITSAPSLAQNQILSGRDEVTLTPAQQAIVDKITKATGTVNVGVLERTDTLDPGPSENRYATVVLPLGDGKDIGLIRTRPSVKSERDVAWRGVADDTGERAILALWNDGHLSDNLAGNSP